MNKKEQAEDQKPPPDVEDFLPMKLCLRHSERAQVEYDDGQQEKHLFSTLIAVNGRKSLKINKVTLCIWIFGWRKLSLHHVRTQETPQIRCL